jgi:hypothetical protein
VNVIDSPQLIVQTPDGVQQVNLLERQEWTIGRDRANLIRIPDRYASRFHAMLGVYKERHCYFWDLSSRNGSLINGQPFVGSVLLKHGDRITIGNTVLALRHDFVTSPQLPLPQPQHQVLMMHSSAIQGKIWQELLLSQDIGIRWEIPGVDIKKLISLQTAANILPPLLILDTQAIQDDLYGLCHWCHQQKLAVNLLLIDSSRYDISESERTYVLKQGFLNLFPAFNTAQLLTHAPQIRQRLFSILTVFNHQPLRPEALLGALQTLEQVLNKPPIAYHQHPLPAELEPDLCDPEDLTSLQVDPRKINPAKKS